MPSPLQLPPISCLPQLQNCQDVLWRPNFPFYAITPPQKGPQSCPYIHQKHMGFAQPSPPSTLWKHWEHWSLLSPWSIFFHWPPWYHVTCLVLTTFADSSSMQPLNGGVPWDSIVGSPLILCPLLRQSRHAPGFSDQMASVLSPPLKLAGREMWSWGRGPISLVMGGNWSTVTERKRKGCWRIEKKKKKKDGYYSHTFQVNSFKAMKQALFGSQKFLVTGPLSGTKGRPNKILISFEDRTLRGE